MAERCLFVKIHTFKDILEGFRERPGLEVWDTVFAAEVEETELGPVHLEEVATQMRRRHAVVL